MKRIAVLSILCLFFTTAISSNAMTVAEVEQTTAQLNQDIGKVSGQAAYDIFLVLGAGLTELAKNMEANKITATDRKILNSLENVLPPIFSEMKDGYQNPPASLTTEGKKLVRFLYLKQNEYNLKDYGLPEGGIDFPTGADYEYALASTLSYALVWATKIPVQYDQQGNITQGLSLPVYTFSMLYADLIERCQKLLDNQQMQEQLQQAYQGLLY